MGGCTIGFVLRYILQIIGLWKSSFGNDSGSACRCYQCSYQLLPQSVIRQEKERKTFPNLFLEKNFVKHVVSNRFLSFFGVFLEKTPFFVQYFLPVFLPLKKLGNFICCLKVSFWARRSFNSPQEAKYLFIRPSSIGLVIAYFLSNEWIIELLIEK